ncbi:MAG TPA: PopZ family protein [Rickettsia endosymbiont of Pyrocoelia pectoralis]|nr:PopZ family protein [Rickettsia endosymbiont of Pyrocoelia pectoralis]
MSKESKKPQDMSIEDILKSIKGVISERKNLNYEDAEESEDDVLELTEVISGADEEKRDLDDEEDQLISSKSAEEIGNVFKNFTDTIKNKKLDNNITSKNALEELVAEMLRPELKIWLDKNLPILVKDLVESEIRKILQSNGRK